ncbi:MAG TPA: hypothetical protein VE155_07105 [Pseudonocardiaceae bacterium]|jgi:hypothetical protein|nr:hypothetical protein [Pseudonocardiaceae bacterium]
MIKRIFATVTMAGILIVASVTAAAPAFACGDTPGFCPNPPDSSSAAPWVVGAGGDWN